MEGQAQLVAVPYGDNVVVHGGQNFYIGIVHGFDVRRSNEYHRKFADALDRLIRDEAAQLSSVCVSPNRNGKGGPDGLPDRCKGSAPEEIIPAQVASTGSPSRIQV